MSPHELLTNVLSAEKVVKAPTWNRLGLQVARSLVARSLHRLRPWSDEEGVRDAVERLRRTGLLIWPRFLPDAEFVALKDEVTEFWRTRVDLLSVHREGRTRLEQLVVDMHPGLLPRVERLLVDSRLVGIIEGAEKRRWAGAAQFSALQKLINTGEGGLDPESEIHSDTFHDTHKAWLYLCPVTMDNGPFCFVEGSHRLTAARLLSIYRHSVSAAGNSAPRVGSADSLFLEERETRVVCEANTLVVANTFGYHRRWPVHTGGPERHAVHVITRREPFLRSYRGNQKR